MKKILYKLLPIFALALIIGGCAPVNMTTKTKKVPRQYSVNYNYPNIKAEKSEVNKTAWIVYSDRVGNFTTHVPGGAVPHTELEFMEPMLVIGEKDGYYKLIKYDENVLENEKLTNRKQVEYYGWLPKDRLLLFDNSITEIRNGLKLRSLTAITNSDCLRNIDKYVSGDAVILYGQPSLREPSGQQIGLNNVVYVMKMSDQDSRALIAHKSSISPDNAADMVIGWVDASLIAPMGQNLMLQTPAYVQETDEEGEIYMREVKSPVGFTPLLFADKVTDSLRFRTLDTHQILDRSDNKVYNVVGEPISYNESRVIAENLSKINVIFTFDMTQNVVEQMPMLSNTIQNIKFIFGQHPYALNYQFAAVMGRTVIPFTDDYTYFSDTVIDAGKHVHIDNSETALYKAVQLAGQMPEATNIIIHIGETATSGEKPSRDIVDGFIRNNCRLLSYQVYADTPNEYNNFVLQSTALIEAYASSISKSKRNMIVYSDQLRSENLFKENTKNSYYLDYPSRSMTQGIVIFPEKKQISGPDNLINAINSIVRQVEDDNFEIISSLDLAFNQVGNHRNRLDEYFAENNDLDHTQYVGAYFDNAFVEMSPQWVTVTDRIKIPMDERNISELGLLISETELEQLRQFMELLTEKELEIQGVDYSDSEKPQSVNWARQNMRNVPSDSLLTMSALSSGSGEAPQIKFVNTGRVRHYLELAYLAELKKCVVEGNPKKLTLAQAHEYITSAPTTNPWLKRYRIKDLRRKKVLTDENLNILLELFNEHKRIIEEEAVPAHNLNVPEGEKYYYLPCSALP